ncbi:Hypothetical predicted protein [Octopus vulgaris]|uniref:Uncharacterized protein n=1 Tax=Octopus vulgaris TaxID=6645 RepID=A0AA36FES3_OCTVU|nr:Hypothetical predicted protein [Octopus vulgaris]
MRKCKLKKKKKKEKLSLEEKECTGEKFYCNKTCSNIEMLNRFPSKITMMKNSIRIQQQMEIIRIQVMNKFHSRSTGLRIESSTGFKVICEQIRHDEDFKE